MANNVGTKGILEDSGGFKTHKVIIWMAVWLIMLGLKGLKNSAWKWPLCAGTAVENFGRVTFLFSIFNGKSEFLGPKVGLFSFRSVNGGCVSKKSLFWTVWIFPKKSVPSKINIFQLFFWKMFSFSCTFREKYQVCDECKFDLKFWWLILPVLWRHRFWG